MRSILRDLIFRMGFFLIMSSISNQEKKERKVLMCVWILLSFSLRSSAK